MKWVVRIGLGLLALIVLVVAGFAAVPWFTVGAERLSAKPYRAHLAANETVLDLAAPDANLALAPEHYDARYVLLGEMHGFAVPQRLDAAMVRHLAEAGPARWYLAEMSPHEAMAANAYVSGGEAAGIEAVFDRFADMGLQWNSIDFFEKLTAIRNLNEALPPERRVRFIGIDAPREPALAGPDMGVASAPDLGRHADDAALAINLALADTGEAGQGRYQTIADRMTALAAMPGWAAARFYGFWGLGHTSEVPINGAVPLAIWLQREDAPWAGEVVTINTMCLGACYNMMVAAGLPGPMQPPNGEGYVYVPMGQHQPYFMRAKGAGDLLAALGEDDIALYRLGTPDSPYRDGDRITGVTGYLAKVNRWEVEGSAADMTDYLIVFRGSPPLRPRRGEAHDLTGDAAASL